MSDEPTGGGNSRLDRIRAIVEEDYDRITMGDDPYIILNVRRGTKLQDVISRYERYERFYRMENFRRLGDMELTRKALDIRRAIGRAVAELREHLENNTPNTKQNNRTNDQGPTDDQVALAHFFFRDGLTYLQLGDLSEAENWFEFAYKLDFHRGLYLAYASYTSYRQKPYDPDAVEQTRENLAHAVELEGDNPDILVLQARFLMKMGELDKAAQCVDRIEIIDEDHPMLPKLKKKFAAHRSQSDNK